MQTEPAIVRSILQSCFFALLNELESSQESPKEMKDEAMQSAPNDMR